MLLRVAKGCRLKRVWMSYWWMLSWIRWSASDLCRSYTVRSMVRQQAKSTFTLAAQASGSTLHQALWRGRGDQRLVFQQTVGNVNGVGIFCFSGHWLVVPLSDESTSDAPNETVFMRLCVPATVIVNIEDSGKDSGNQTAISYTSRLTAFSSYVCSIDTVNHVSRLTNVL